MTGTRTRAPSKDRLAVKVKGGTYSMPRACPTKAVPQIMAVRSSIRKFLIGIWKAADSELAGMTPADRTAHFNGTGAVEMR